MNIETITAENMEVGMSLIDLDNGYVFEVVDPASNLLTWRDYYSGGLDNQLVFIGYHDAEGDENYLVVRPNAEFKVTRDYQ